MSLHITKQDKLPATPEQAALAALKEMEVGDSISVEQSFFLGDRRWHGGISTAWQDKAYDVFHDAARALGYKLDRRVYVGSIKIWRTA